MNFPKGIHVYGSKEYHGRCPLEKYETQAFFALLRNLHPNLGAIAIHVRNESDQRTSVKAWMKAKQRRQEGQVAGASDIIIPGNPSFVCELKRKDHKLSEITEAQVDYLQAAKANGSFVCIALGADAALNAVGHWLEYTNKLALERQATLRLKENKQELSL